MGSMPSLREYFNERILLEKDKYKWLMERLVGSNVQVRRIANFGCGEGWETLALMWMLAASEGAGIDKEDRDISNACGTLQSIQNIILAKGVPNDSPPFLKTPQLQQAVQFYQADFVKRTQLQSDYYDIAFCNFVLYHIFLNQGGEKKTQEAINEMARVVIPGGFVAAREPTRSTVKKAFDIDFKPIFRRAGLIPLVEESESYEGGVETLHLYRKLVV